MIPPFLISLLKEHLGEPLFQGSTGKDSAQRDLSSLKPGDIIQGKIVGRDGALDILEYDSGKIRVMGQVDLQVGTRVRLRVTKVSSPLEVRLEEVIPDKAGPRQDAVERAAVRMEESFSRLKGIIRYAKKRPAAPEERPALPEKSAASPARILKALSLTGSEKAEDLKALALFQAAYGSKILKVLERTQGTEGAFPGAGRKNPDDLSSKEKPEVPLSQGRAAGNVSSKTQDVVSVSKFQKELGVPVQTSSPAQEAVSGKAKDLEAFSPAAGPSVDEEAGNLQDSQGSRGSPLMGKKTDTIEDRGSINPDKRPASPGPSCSGQRSGSKEEIISRNVSSSIEEDGADPSRISFRRSGSFGQDMSGVREHTGQGGGDKVPGAAGPQEDTGRSSTGTRPAASEFSVLNKNASFLRQDGAVSESTTKDEIQRGAVAGKGLEGAEAAKRHDGRVPAAENSGPGSIDTSVSMDTRTSLVEGRETEHAVFREFSSHVELASQLQHHVLKEAGLNIFIFPFLFADLEGAGQWGFWKEQNKASGEKNPETSEYHLVFDLYLKRLGQLNIHLLKKEDNLSLLLAAEKDKLPVIRQGLSEVSTRIKALGFRFESITCLPLEKGSGALVSSFFMDSDRDTRFHLVT